MSLTPQSDENAADRAVADRLASLRSLRMDTAAFDAKFKQICPLPRSAERDEPRRLLLWPFTSPLRAVAACLTVGLTLFFAYLAFAPQPVLASPQRMAEVYQDAVSGHGHSTPVASLTEAKAVLQQKWDRSPAVPTTAGELQVMSCCVHEVGHKRMACVTFRVDGEPVTLAMADARDVDSPRGEVRIVGSQRYVVHSQDGVNMAMSKREGTWMCVMGRLPIVRLVEIAESIRN